MFIRDYADGGRGFGPVGNALGRIRWDSGMMRPYFDDDGRPAVTINRGRWTTEKGVRTPLREHVLIRDLVNNGINSPVLNATTLRKEEWLELDRMVLRAARYRLRAYADLASANPFGGFNAMAKTVLEHETMTDPGEAIVDMDGLTPDRTDGPKFQLEGLPLPITHGGFWFSQRYLAESRNTGTPLDTTMGEAVSRRVAEGVEKTTIGVTTGITYGGASTQIGGYGRTPSVYGYINFPARLVKTNLSDPSASGWFPQMTLTDVLAMRQSMMRNKFYGPYMLYHSNDWDTYLDNDYYVSSGSGAVAPQKSLRSRLKEIEGIQDVRRLDFLFGAQLETNPANVKSSTNIGGYAGPGADVDVVLKPFRFIMVQMTPDVARAVNGLDITTLQWETIAGMQLNFKVLCIQVAQLRADAYSNCGIMDATNS